ncbi:MAG: GNAT family N-acetyltransferase [Anaerolineae bacterium]
MASYTFARTHAPRGLQPFDPARHMFQVAELVAQVFAEELDAKGRQALREMRWIGRVSPLLGGMLTMALLNEDFTGHVWLEEGRVVGNVTVQQADMSGMRWRISNVAVASPYRGRGIGRALMQAALAEIAERGGNWALLQVRADNQVARQLYHSLRFEDVARVGLWRLPALRWQPQERNTTLQVEPLQARHGREWLALARAARSDLARWYEEVRAEEYELSMGQRLGELLGRAVGVLDVARWGLRQEGRLVAAIEARTTLFAGYDTLRFTVHPAMRGKVERALLAQALAWLARPGALPVVVEHDGEHMEGVQALQEAGFRIQRDLITMRRAISRADVQA